MMLQSQKTKIRCGQRNKMFATSRNFANPQIMHNERRAHECNICDEAFMRKRKVKIALKLMHIGGKLTDSNYCYKKFSTQEEFAEGTNHVNAMFVKKYFHLETI